MILDIVIFGLSITSSWGNGHAATYRALAKALHQRGHNVTFLEREVPWYRDNRDLIDADYCRIELYDHLREVPRRFGQLVADANLVIIGSYVPDGVRLADWITSCARGITAFYDIDTPVTLASLDLGKASYVAAALIPRFDLYLSFTGGPVLNIIEDIYGSPRARALHCAADLSPTAEPDIPFRWALGYLGTYAPDRQPALEALLLETSRQLSDQQFVVAGPKYPDDIQWPANVTRIEHLPPSRHQEFYAGQRFTLNVTRHNMRLAGFSPSVRLFEAAASGVPIVTDNWPGLETFFTPGREILVVEGTREVIQVISELPEERRRDIAAACRQRLLRSHTPQHRARQLESYYMEAMAGRRTARRLEVITSGVNFT
jgi:spore maturation protein CgeB